MFLLRAFSQHSLPVGCGNASFSWMPTANKTSFCPFTFSVASCSSAFCFELFRAFAAESDFYLIWGLKLRPLREIFRHFISFLILSLCHVVGTFGDVFIFLFLRFSSAGWQPSCFFIIVFTEAARSYAERECSHLLQVGFSPLLFVMMICLKCSLIKSHHGPRSAPIYLIVKKHV